MRADAMIANMVKKLGRETTLEAADGTQTTVTALIQPVRSKSRQAMEQTAIGTGRYGAEQYVYLGPPEAELTDTRRIGAGGAWYRVRRAERVVVHERTAYCWALLIRDGGDAPWKN